MNRIKKIGMLAFFALSFMCCNHNGKSDQENPKPAVTPKSKMEITGFSIGATPQNPATLLDGKKKITVHVNEPTLNIALKEKYEDLAGTVKVGGNSQNLTFDASGMASYKFPAILENVETNIEIKITAKNKEDILLKFVLIYKPYDKVNITKISVADKDFVPPFDSLRGSTIDVKNNTATITVETSSDTQELKGTVNETNNLILDPVRPNIARIPLNNLAEGDNSILLKVKAKERMEETFSFKIKYTKPVEPPVSIASITIDDQVFIQGSKLETLNNSTVEITKETFDLKVELSEDYAGKKVRVSNGTESVSTKDSDWQGMVATLKCNDQYKDITIRVSATDRQAVTYKVKVNRIKAIIDVMQIELDEAKYGKFGDDLNKLLKSSATTETINVKKAKVNVKVTLNSGESVEKAEIVQENTTHTQLTFSGTIANATLTLKEGNNNFTLHLEKTIGVTKINADYKFIFNYKKEDIKFKSIKLKLDDSDKGIEEYELQNFVASFAIDGDVLSCKKDYSLWDTKATFFCGIKNAQNKFEYATSKTNTLPASWQIFTKNFDVTLDDSSTYVFMKISNASSHAIYRCELASIVNVKETAVLKKDVKCLDAEGNELYEESGLTKKIRIMIKPKDPKINGIDLKEPSTIAFTKITEERYKNWYQVEFPITEHIGEIKTINAKYEVKAQDGIEKTEYIEEIKLIPTLKDFELSYDDKFTTQVKAVFEPTTNTYNFTIDKGSVVDKKLFLRVYIAEYYKISSEGIEFVEGEGKTIDNQYYILKTFNISDFENTKTFKLTIEDENGKGATEYNVEIK